MTILAVFGLVVMFASRTLQAQFDKYGVHHVTTRPAVPACDAANGVVCLIDSTRKYFDECCMVSSDAEWLVLAHATDSLEFFVVAGAASPAAAYVSMINGRRGFQEHDVNTASYLRLRAPVSGMYHLTVGLDPDNRKIGIPYELRVRTIPARRIAAPPILHLEGRRGARFRVRAVAPRELATPPSEFSVEAGAYRLLAPGVDSVEVCRMPCKSPRVIAVAGPPSRTLLP